MTLSQAIIVSNAAFAAEVADEAPLASITAFPRCCTVGRNVFSTQSLSLITSAPLAPSIKAFSISGYIVGLWLPHMIMCLISLTALLTFFATTDLALLESSIVIAIHNCLSLFAAFLPIKAFVLAGLPTTSIFAFTFAFLPIDSP